MTDTTNTNAGGKAASPIMHTRVPFPASRGEHERTASETSDLLDRFAQSLEMASSLLTAEKSKSELQVAITGLKIVRLILGR